jgi:hypothetical protein
MSPSPNPSRPTKLTIEDIQNLKDLFADNPGIKWSIIAAGIGGALEGFHILWLLSLRLGLFR